MNVVGLRHLRGIVLSDHMGCLVMRAVSRWHRGGVLLRSHECHLTLMPYDLNSPLSLCTSKLSEIFGRSSSMVIICWKYRSSFMMILWKYDLPRKSRLPACPNVVKANALVRNVLVRKVTVTDAYAMQT